MSGANDGSSPHSWRERLGSALSVMGQLALGLGTALTAIFLTGPPSYGGLNEMYGWGVAILTVATTVPVLLVALALGTGLRPRLSFMRPFNPLSGLLLFILFIFIVKSS